MHSISDETLALILHTGSHAEKQDALFTLHARLYDKSLRYAAKYFGGDLNRASEPVNEAWWEFYKLVNREGPPESVMRLLRHIIKCRCFKAINRENLEIKYLIRQYERQQLWLSHEERINRDNEFEHKRRVTRVFYIEGNLSRKQKKVWKLRVEEGLTLEEISEREGMTINNVRVTFSNARKKFLRYLDTHRYHL
jgi:RNA polymerase sigma factor (sigma-70 family)